MDSNEVYSPPESLVEDKLEEPKSRKFVMAMVCFAFSYAGIMLFFILGELVSRSESADFIFETEFQLASFVCSALTSALLYPVRSIAWYFQAMIASIAGLAILIATLFLINEVMG